MSSKTPTQKPKKSKAFGWIVGGSVLAVAIVLGAFFVNALERSEQERNTAVPALSTGMGKPIVIGESEAPITLELFEDFQCPSCKAVEGFFSNVINDAISQGTAKVAYYPVAFLSEGSKIASNAAACAADQGKFEEYHQAIFAHQPDKSSGAQLDEALMLSLGKSALMPDESKFEKCVTGNRYGTWVASLEKVMADRKVTGTPALFVNGEPFSVREATRLDFAVALGLVEAPVAEKPADPKK
jgi:protein-disulfide isomerase